MVQIVHTHLAQLSRGHVYTPRPRSVCTVCVSNTNTETLVTRELGGRYQAENLQPIRSKLTHLK